MALKPARKNFSIWKGGTWRKVLTLHTGDSTSSPLRNLTGCTARMAIKDVDDNTLLSLTTENGGITLGGAAGTITLYVSDEASALLTWASGRYVLYITEPDGDSDPYLHGTVNAVGI